MRFVKICSATSRRRVAKRVPEVSVTVPSLSSQFDHLSEIRHNFSHVAIFLRTLNVRVHVPGTVSQDAWTVISEGAALCMHDFERGCARSSTCHHKKKT